MDIDNTRRYLRSAVWGLPVFTGLLTLGTLTHQPDVDADYAGYADYVTTPVFLVSHLGASILGAAIGIVALSSVAVLAAADGSRPGRSLLGAGLSVVGNVVNTAIYGVAAFFQPAIGRAFHAGAEGAEALDGDVYGPALFATAGVALLTWSAGAVLLGVGVGGLGRHVRIPGAVLAGALVAFYVAGQLPGPVQPVMGAIATVASVVLVRRMTAVRREPALVS
jgi:hypothetical protein